MSDDVRPGGGQFMCSICGVFEGVAEAGVEMITLVRNGADVVTYLACQSCEVTIRSIEEQLGGFSLYALGMLHIEDRRATFENCEGIADRVVETIRSQVREEEIATRRRNLVVICGGKDACAPDNVERKS